MARESSVQKLERMTVIEKRLTEEAGRNILIAGIDEVGRGPLAGPVVTACVCLPLSELIPGIDDSKKLSEKKREELYPQIIERAAYAKTAWIWQDEIDEINILNATKKAMEACASGFAGDVILVDAVSGLKLPCRYESIIKGDAKSYMIAAASIVAKVERDRYMKEMDEKYPEYGFASNKGYGTQEHIEALKRSGPCELHRRSFIKNLI
ncbi:MAG: ribonuclease HII [Clostridia bacterium]|nr:ribonuclease HII [Clostridia bacterium]